MYFVASCSVNEWVWNYQPVLPIVIICQPLKHRVLRLEQKLMKHIYRVVQKYSVIPYLYLLIYLSFYLSIYISFYLFIIIIYPSIYSIYPSRSLKSINRYELILVVERPPLHITLSVQPAYTIYTCHRHLDQFVSPFVKSFLFWFCTALVQNQNEHDVN